VWLGERSGVGVAEVRDVAQDLVDRAGIALPLAGRPAGETFQLRQQRL